MNLGTRVVTQRAITRLVSRARDHRIAGLAFVVALASVACSNGPARAPAQPRRDAHTVALDTLLPGDEDLVVRADLARARSQSVFDDVMVWLRGAQLSDAMLDTARPCLEKASSATLAIRLGPSGLDGDALLRMSMPDDDSGGVPCGAKGWKATGDSGGVSVFEPQAPEHHRSAPAMILRDQAGNVLVVTPGQIDSVLRLVRDGPDAETLEPPRDAMVGLAARVGDNALPQAWRDKSPMVATLARGLSTFVLRIDVGDRVNVRATLVYADGKAAADASQTLRRVHDALVRSDRGAYQAAAEAAHAQREGETIRVDMTLPRGL